MTDLWLSGVFFQALNSPKLVFGLWTPLGELMTFPRPLVGWGGGHPIPIPFPSTPSASHLGAFSASVVTTQIPDSISLEEDISRRPTTVNW